jgi:DNA-directed RNA polymerase subunit RPC12/RpoP
MHIEREEDLLNPDFNPNVNVSSVGIKCPNCGANITVPYGMSRICPYCDSKITVDRNGRLVG